MTNGTSSPGNESKQTFSELVYADDEVRDLIVARWPHARIEDARDSIHRERFSVDIEGVSQDDFYGWAIVEGWVRCCLGFELCVRLPEKEHKVRRWLARADELKAAEVAS